MAYYILLPMKITILCGGPSSEHEISLKSSESIFQSLTHSAHTLSVLYISRDKRAYLFTPTNSLAEEVATLSDSHLELLETILQKNKDTIGIALLAGIHGEFAEDGQLQELLDQHGIPFTGSSAASSRLCIDKYATCKAIEEIEPLVNPTMLLIQAGTHLPEKSHFPISFPVILKPNSLGSSVGISICDSYEELSHQIHTLQDDYPKENILITDYINNGVEISCGCLQKKDGSFVPIPPVEIVPQGHEFFDYASKYDVGGAQEIIPPPSLSPDMSSLISKLACTVHQKLGCSTYSRSDFMVKNNIIYFIETNTLPGFTETSLFPQETAAVGMDLKDTLEFILNNSAR